MCFYLYFIQMDQLIKTIMSFKLCNYTIYAQCLRVYTHFFKSFYINLFSFTLEMHSCTCLKLTCKPSVFAQQQQISSNKKTAYTTQFYIKWNTKLVSMTHFMLDFKNLFVWKNCTYSLHKKYRTLALESFPSNIPLFWKQKPSSATRNTQTRC